MTMSHDTFVALMRGYNDDEVPPAQGRRESIHRRIRRIRRRRTAAACGVTAVVVLAAGVTPALWPSRPTPPAPSATSTAMPPAATSMPMSWVAADGVAYLRIGVATLDTSTSRKSVTVTVPVGTTPIAVVSGCVPVDAQATQAVKIGVGTTSVASSSAVYCGDGTLAALSPSLAGATRLTDYDPTAVAHPDGSIALTFDGSKNAYTSADITSPPPVTVHPARWTFGIYMWLIPKHLTPPGPAPVLPATLASTWHLHTTYTGTWPQKRDVSFPIPPGVRWGYVYVCPGALAGAVQDVDLDRHSNQVMVNGITVTTDGSLRGGQGCGHNPQVTGAALVDMSLNNSSSTLTAKITQTYTNLYDARSGAWAIGVYFDTER